MNPTILSQYLHNGHTILAHDSHNTCALLTQYLHNTHTILAQPSHYTHTHAMFTPCLHQAQIIIAQCSHTTCTPPTQYCHTPHTQLAQYPPPQRGGQQVGCAQCVQPQHNNTDMRLHVCVLRACLVCVHVWCVSRCACVSGCCACAGVRVLLLCYGSVDGVVRCSASMQV